MGTVFKRTATKPLPVGVEFVVRRGQRFAKWRDAKGRMRTAPVVVLTEGAFAGQERLAVETPTYTAKYRDGAGLVQTFATGCRDEDAARSVLSKLERRAELVRSEIISPAEDATADHQLTPLAQHVAAFHEHRTAKGLNATRIANTKS